MLSWPPSDPIINLARYDVSIVNSMAEQINRGLGFSDKQAILAHKIVCKYKRQWNLAGYDVTQQQENGLFKLPIRTIDRSTLIDIDENKILIRFPYNQDLISKVRANTNDIPGSCFFDKDKRCWVASLIEPRIKWAYKFGNENNFEFSQEFITVYELVKDCPEYKICLKANSQQFFIENAAESLVDYINQHGGFGYDNIVKLIDMAGVLGYTVEESVFKYVNSNLSIESIRIMTQRETNITYDIGSDIDLSHTIAYAELTGRFPIYVYEANTNQIRTQLDRYFSSSDIVDRKLNPQSKAKGKVIYFNHWRLADLAIPLLVTTHVLMIGNRRQQMLQCSDKIVFFSQRVENDTVLATDT